MVAVYFLFMWLTRADGSPGIAGSSSSSFETCHLRKFGHETRHRVRRVHDALREIEKAAAYLMDPMRAGSLGPYVFFFLHLGHPDFEQAEQ